MYFGLTIRRNTCIRENKTTFTMDNIPPEVKEMILHFLPLRDICCMAQINKEWAAVAIKYKGSIHDKKIKINNSLAESLIAERNDPAKAIKRYEYVKLLTISHLNLKRFFSQFQDCLYRLHIKQCELRFSNLLFAIGKMEMLEHLKLSKNTWLDEIRTLQPFTLMSQSCVRRVILKDNRAQNRTGSAQSFESFVNSCPNVDNFILVGASLTFPSLVSNNMIWNIQVLWLESITVSSFQALDFNIDFFPNARQLILKNSRNFFLASQSNILSILRKGQWYLVGFYYDDDIFMNDKVNPSTAWDEHQILSIRAIKNEVYRFDEKLVQFPNLAKYGPYSGASTSLNAPLTNLIHLEICEMSVEYASNLFSSLAFKQINKLTLIHVSSYQMMMPQIYAHMPQLIKLKIVGLYQPHWVEDHELTGFHAHTRHSIIKSKGWGDPEYTDTFDYGQQLDNFGIKLLRRLKSLIFIGTDKMLTDFSILYGIGHLNELETLILPYSSITNIGLVAISNIRDLKYLDISHCDHVEREQVETLTRDLPTLKIIFD